MMAAMSEGAGPGLEPWQRLGIKLTADRVRRGHRSLSALALATGLSQSTLDNLVHARKTSYDPATLAALEQTLGWKPGSVERVLNGLEPLYDDDPDLTALIELWPRLPPTTRRLLRMIAMESLLDD